MADTQISQFTPDASPLDGDYVGGYKGSLAGQVGANRRWSFTTLFSYIASKFLSTPEPVRSYRPSATTFSGTTGTLALADAQYFQICTNASAQTLTIPTNASVAFSVDTEITFFNQGTNNLTFVGATGVTIQSHGSSLKVIPNGEVVLKKIATDTWTLAGDLVYPVVPIIQIDTYNKSSISPYVAYQNLSSTATGTISTNSIALSGNESTRVYAGMTISLSGTDIYTVASVSTSGTTTVITTTPLTANYTTAVAAVPRVSQANDISGNGYNVVQATAANQFLYNVTGLNGIPTLQGNGSTTFLHNDSIDLRVVGTKGWVEFLVVQKNNTSRADPATYKNQPGGADAFGMVYDGSQHLDYFPASTGGGTPASFTGTATNAINTPHIFCFAKFDNNTFLSYIDGVVDTTTTDTADYGLLASGTQLWLGANRNTSSSPQFVLLGHLLNYQFFTQELSIAQIKAIFRELSIKYNIQVTV